MRMWVNCTLWYVICQIRIHCYRECSGNINIIYAWEKEVSICYLHNAGEGSLNLDWPTGYDICLQVARSLAYLHEESRIRIVHRDMKASNILLDSDLIPKTSDFGLAKLYNDKKTRISTRVAGTM